MSDKEVMSQLIEYLKNEYVRLSDQKEEILMKKIRLQIEEEKEESPLFDMCLAMQAKSFLAPFFVKDDKENKDYEKKNSADLENIDNTVNNIQSEMEQLKSYISCVQDMMEPNEPIEPEVTTEEERLDVDPEEERIIHYETDELPEMLHEIMEFLKLQYDKVEFFIDCPEVVSSDSSLNYNLVRILTYNISSILESKNADTVILEVHDLDSLIKVSLKIVMDEEITDQFEYQFSVNER